MVAMKLESWLQNTAMNWEDVTWMTQEPRSEQPKPLSKWAANSSHAASPDTVTRYWDRTDIKLTHTHKKKGVILQDKDKTMQFSKILVVRWM